MINLDFLIWILTLCLIILITLSWNRKLSKEIQEHRHTQNRFNESEEKYKHLVELAPDAIVVYQDEIIKYANTACIKIIGAKQPEDIIGRSIWNFVHKDFKETIKERIRLVIEEKKATNFTELQFIRLDGQPVITESNISAIIYQGKPAIQAVLRNITKRKQMEQDLKYREASNKALLNAIPDLMFHISGQGDFLQVHGARDELYAEPEKVTGKNIKDILPEYLAAMTMDYIHRTLETGDLQTYKYQLPMHGILCDFEARMVPVASNEIIALVRNITEFRKAKAELIKAKETAEAASRAKSEFLANIGHEIRTPMNAIVGMTHLALETELTNCQKDYLKKISASSYALLGIINDILDFSRIESGRMNIYNAEFNLEDVLNHIFDNFKKQCIEKGIKISFSISHDVPKLLIGDSRRLGQILNNLVSNAVKFTEKGEIKINIENLNKTSDNLELQFSVTDTGIGILPGEIKNLFEAFIQADGSSSRKFGGTGLGLAISRHLVKMMKGEIRVQSSPGKGSIFSFTAQFYLQSIKKDNMSLVKLKNNMLELKSEKPLSHTLIYNNPKPCPLLLNRLRELLENGDTDAFQHAETLYKYLAETRYENQASLLVKQVEAYDFEDAKKTLDKISKILI